jgi:ComF family protein
MSVWERLSDALFPPRCPFCGRILDRPGICDRCREELSWTEGEESERTVAGGVRCAAPLWYDELVRNGILHYKFQGGSASAVPLGEVIARCVADRFSGAFDTVTWVPLSRKRLRSRGYDQARMLAESACRLWDVPPERLLCKNADNQKQSGIREASARQANVLGVYDLAPGARIAGKRILVVDDVVTTGATLGECARVLRDAGAQDVLCAALARTRPPGSASRQEKT